MMREVHIAIVIGIITAVSAFIPARAQDKSAGDEDVYTVSDIAVDVTANSASVARKQAFDDAQRKAFKKLLKRIVSADAWKQIKVPAEQKLGSLVKNYGIDNEQVSKVRYKASYTFTFNKKSVRNFLSDRGIAYSETKGEPLLVLPFFQQGRQLNLWRGYNPWLEVWSNSPAHEGLLPLEVPIGDLSDVRKINGDNALTYDPQDLDRMLKRYEAKEAVLLIAAFNEGPPPRSKDAPAYTPLTVYIYRTDSKMPQFVRSLYLRPDSATDLRDLLKRGMREVVNLLRKDWKDQTAVQPGQRETIEAVVRFNELDEWLAMQKQLRGLGDIDNFEIRELSADRARLALGYRGDMQNFSRALRRAGLQANAVYSGQRGRHTSGGEGHNPVINIRKDSKTIGQEQPRWLRHDKQDRGRNDIGGRSGSRREQPRTRFETPENYADDYLDHDSGTQNYRRGY
mgnify:CR=1 FL=1